jgi:hypothetical protein
MNPRSLANLKVTPQSLANLRLGSAAAGAKNREAGHIQALGRVQGRKNAESGVLARALTPEILRAAGKKGGAQRAIETDNLESIKTPESLAAGGHKRHHVDGGKFNPKCALCQEGRI